jgi:hypothetical protein
MVALAWRLISYVVSKLPIFGSKMVALAWRLISDVVSRLPKLVALTWQLISDVVSRLPIFEPEFRPKMVAELAFD